MKNSMRFKKIFYAICLIGSSILLARFCHHQTKGFAISKITANFPLRRELNLEKERATCSPEIFNQKFRFLSRGLQSFVFVSADNQYVLKLLNNRYQKKISFFSLLSHLTPGIPWAATQKVLFQTKLKNSFTSYEIAFDEMADKTALLYLHLHPTSDLPSTMTLIATL